MYIPTDNPKTGFVKKAVIFSLSTVLSFGTALTAVAERSNNLSLDSTLHGGLTNEQGYGKQGDTATYIVILEEESLANYSGGKNNMAGTSVRATGGVKLDTRSAAASTYVDFLKARQNDILGNSAVPTARQPSLLTVTTTQSTVLLPAYQLQKPLTPKQ